MATNHEDEFAGPWWRYPILRNALLAGALAGIGFVLAHLGFIPEKVEVGLYLVAIPLGGHHWAREGIETLVHEREVGIDILAATTAQPCWSLLPSSLSPPGSGASRWPAGPPVRSYFWWQPRPVRW